MLTKLEDLKRRKTREAESSHDLKVASPSSHLLGVLRDDLSRFYFSKLEPYGEVTLR